MLFLSINFREKLLFFVKHLKIMSEITITTSQNVNLQFKTASIGERILAFAIDMMIRAAYLFIVFNIISSFNFFTFYDWDYWSIAALVGLISLPATLYPVVLESLMEGQTIGKRIMKIKIVKIDGYQASFGDYLMRWVMALVDTYSNGGAIGIICIITTKNNQRLGDLATGTAVISLRNNINISHTILENIKEDYQPTFPQVIALSDNDIRIVKNNFYNAERTNDRIVIKELSNKIKSVLKLEDHQVTLTDRQFITTILKDYNFYTGKEF